MKKLILFLLCSLCIASMYAETTKLPQTTTTYPEDGRYEIVLSSIAVYDSFLLDRETGKTWVLTKTKSGYKWQEFYRMTHKKDVIPDGHKGPVYQIVLSGLTVKDTFLINTLTGATYILYEDSNENLYWDVVE